MSIKPDARAADNQAMTTLDKLLAAFAVVLVVNIGLMVVALSHSLH
jgi:hypothetical protein